MKRLRLAFFSPLPPERSGVADYSAELLPELVRLADVTIVRPTRETAPRNPATGLPALPTERFLEEAARFDIAVYQVANNFTHHGYMLPCLARVPGLVVLHDCALQYLMLNATLRRGDFAALVDLLRPRFGSEAKQRARRLLLGLSDASTLSFAGPIVSGSRGVVVHSGFAADWVRGLDPGALVRIVPMGVPPPAVLEPMSVLRRRHGFAEDDFVLASISTLSAAKRTEMILEALPGLVRRHPKLRFVIVGTGAPGFRARRQIASAGLEGVVRHTGWLPREAYHELIALADVVVDLRHPSAGETSASLGRAMAAGKPAILSAQGTFLEVPPECAVKLPVDGNEVAALAAAVSRLVENASERQAMGEAARRHAREHLSLSQAAQAYVGFAHELGERGPAAAPSFVGAPRGSRLVRAGVAGLYGATRLLQLVRRYGPADTWRRLREFHWAR